MNKFLIIVFAFFALALAACSGVPGSTGITDLPTIGAGNASVDDPAAAGDSSGLTEAGDVEDEATNPKDDENDDVEDAPSQEIYESRAFGVNIIHPTEWNIEEGADGSVRFSSEAGDALEASFIVLRQGEVGFSFESFLVSVRGGKDGLVSVAAEGFAQALCASGDADEAGLVDVECYYVCQLEPGVVGDRGHGFGCGRPRRVPRLFPGR